MGNRKGSMKSECASECAQRQSGLRGFGEQVCPEESLVSEKGTGVSKVCQGVLGHRVFPYRFWCLARGDCG